MSASHSEEQAEAEADVEGFHDALGPFVVAAEQTRMAMVFTDAKADDNPVIFVNDAYLELTGYSREEVLGQAFGAFLSRSDEATISVMAAEFDGHSDCGSDVCYRRKDGSEFWATMLISPVRDESGDIVQHFASFVDQTAHKDDQAQSKMLIDELNHRVKNTLSTVQSIVIQAFRGNTDPALIREAMESRLFALARSHDLLTEQNWGTANLRDVVARALEPFGVANGRSERFVITGDDFRLTPQATLALGIAFHELATNAVKYGAFSNEAGSIEIDWTMKPRGEGERLLIRWREKGGPPVSGPTRKGFGSRVLERGLAHELEGSVTLDYAAEGVICTIDIPASRAARG